MFIFLSICHLFLFKYFLGSPFPCKTLWSSFFHLSFEFLFTTLSWGLLGGLLGSFGSLQEILNIFKVRIALLGLYLSSIWHLKLLGHFTLAIGTIEITEIVSGLFLIKQEFYWAMPLGFGVDSPSKISHQEQSISLLFFFLQIFLNFLHGRILLEFICFSFVLASSFVAHWKVKVKAKTKVFFLISYTLLLWYQSFLGLYYGAKCFHLLSIQSQNIYFFFGFC